jgi:hypothetical protein
MNALRLSPVFRRTDSTRANRRASMLHATLATLDMV